MNTSHFQANNQTTRSGSATIYQFPVGGRAGMAGGRDKAKPALEMIAPRISVGSGWYHDAAIQEDKWTGEH